ncbi:MAG TPA: hypothetical protein VJL80_10005 [Aeromicrobium sp.]|nr:hypothetical protein [Aeromicrobium sp.]HKY58360.1 hypothetical protein [Aeromicrobium sp.]
MSLWYWYFAAITVANIALLVANWRLNAQAQAILERARRIALDTERLLTEDQ